MEESKGCVKMVGMYGYVDLTNLSSIVIILGRTPLTRGNGTDQRRKRRKLDSV